MDGSERSHLSQESDGRRNFETSSRLALEHAQAGVTVLIFVVAVFGWLLHLTYAKLTQKVSSIPGNIRPIVKLACSGGTVFLAHCIFRSAYSLLAYDEKAITSSAGPAPMSVSSYWFCALVESPYVIGFIAATASNTILVAEHFRVSVLTVSSAVKSKQTRIERRHQESIEKSIRLSWLSGILMASAFLFVALLQAAFLPKEEGDLQSLAYCSLIITVPDPILYSVILLFLFLESSTGFSLFAVSRYRRLIGLRLFTQHLNRARTDLKERFRATDDKSWWKSMEPGIVLHKVLTATCLVTAIGVKYYVSESRTGPKVLMSIGLCTVMAQLSLILPILVHLHRDAELRSQLAALREEASEIIVSRFRGLVASPRGQSGGPEQRY